MKDEKLEEQAALYAAGALAAAEREQFELLLEFYPEAQRLTGRFLEAASTAMLRQWSEETRPSPALKARILGTLSGQSPTNAETGFVFASAKGLVQWVNPAFTEMCGYGVEEVRGNRLGPILQGEKTDRAVAARMRAAVQQGTPCNEAIVNYHKSGTPYLVSIEMTPLRNSEGELLWFAAREHKILQPARAGTRLNAGWAQVD